MHVTNGLPAASSILSLVLGATVVAALFHPTPILLVMLSAGLIVFGFSAAGFVALANWRRGLPVMERMTVPALLVFLGCAAAILCDLDAAVSGMR